jgi:hypothetical protein
MGKRSDSNQKLKLDQFMRVLFKPSKKVTVNLINGLFGESFDPRKVTIHYDNGEFVNDEYDRIFGDLFFTIRKGTDVYNYHVEFQTLTTRR